MVRRSLVPSREAARREITEGRVTVDGAPAAKPARMVSPTENIQLLGPPARYVSRAGQKLESALVDADIDPSGLVCLDAGSSTGGFTDCLLQHGAKRVYSVDVGTNQLHEKVRAHPAVVVYEQTDIRSVSRDLLGEPIQLVVGDLSFISLRLVVPVLADLIEPGVDVLLLVKPQFEAGRREAAKGRGVITDPEIWLRVLNEVTTAAQDVGLALIGASVSAITGRTGNVEFVVKYRRTSVITASYSQQCLEQVVAEAQRRSQQDRSGKGTR